MAFTFGAANTDDIQLPVATSFSGSGVSTIFTAWVYPTTLTAGNVLLGMASNASRVAVDATTSELSLSMDAATTDGVWTTSGLGLVTDLWQFVALAWSGSATPTMDMRAWIGYADTPPVVVSTTQTTAPVGAFTGPAVATIGNGSSSATVSWQGDIEQVDLMSTSAALGGGGPHTFAQTAYGAFSAQSESLLLDRFVRPIWQGQREPLEYGRSASGAVQHVSADLVGLGSALAFAHGISFAAVQVPTYNGVTVSQRRGPRPRFGSAVAGMGSRVLARR